MEYMIIDLFLNELKRKSANYSSKRLIYINIWNLACKPCIDEFQLLERISCQWGKKTTNVFISNHSDNAVNLFLKKNKTEYDNFVFINEMNDLIVKIFNLIEVPRIMYPMHIVMNPEGKILAYLAGAFTNEKDANRLTEFIVSLK